MILQEAAGRVLIVDDAGQSFDGSVSEFMTCEPTYAPCAAPYIVRRWEASRQFISDGSAATGDPFFTAARLAAYAGKIAAYNRQQAAQAWTGSTETTAPEYFINQFTEGDLR